MCSVSVTGMEDAGRPRVVSRTWHVIGGFFSVGAAIVGGVGVERWFVRAVRRWVACGVGMQLKDSFELGGAIAANWAVEADFAYLFRT